MINQAFSRPFFNAFYLNITFLFWTRQLKSLCVFFAIKLKVQNADFSCSQTLLIFSGNLTYEDTANSITYNLVPFVFLIIAFFLFRICKYILSDIFANHLKMFHLNFHAINKIDLKYFYFQAQIHPQLIMLFLARKFKSFIVAIWDFFGWFSYTSITSFETRFPSFFKTLCSSFSFGIVWFLIWRRLILWSTQLRVWST